MVFKMRGKGAWQKSAWALLNLKLFKNSLNCLMSPNHGYSNYIFQKMKAKNIFNKNTQILTFYKILLINNLTLREFIQFT